MKITGVFRGFPGLGRVIAGTELIESLKNDYGCEVMAFSYLQGAKYLNSRGFTQFVEIPPCDVSPLGILPTGFSAANIVENIQDFKPDCIIIDGEPLLLHQMKLCFPNIKLVSLLNPSDLENGGIHESHIRYFRSLYSLADLTIVHGLRLLEKPEGFGRLVSTKTILRREIYSIERKPQKLIYCILGGGTINVDEDFLSSTLKVARHCIELMQLLPEFKCVIACACEEIAARVKLFSGAIANVDVCSDLLAPKEYYGKATLIITRAGRNTLSELAYLGIPAIAFMTGGRFRSGEQAENANHQFKHVVKMSVDIPNTEFIVGAKRLLRIDSVRNKEEGSGRGMALETLCEFLGLRGGVND